MTMLKEIKRDAEGITVECSECGKFYGGDKDADLYDLYIDGCDCESEPSPEVLTKEVPLRTSFAELAGNWAKNQNPRECRKALRKHLRKVRR
jgi:hypothetical protein